MSHQRLLEAENRLDTAMGKAFLAERVVLRGQDLHHDLADLDWFGLHLFAITGRRFSREALELLGYLWACTSYPDPSIWPNNTAALAGSVRSTAGLAMAAGLVSSEAGLFGVKPLVKVLDFFHRARARRAAGQTVEDIVEAEIAEAGLVYGYGRPLASLDERVPHVIRKAEALGFGEGECFRMALAIHDHVGRTRGIGMNIAALDGALGADLGFTPAEFQLYMNLIVYAGQPPCFLDAAARPEGTFFPVRCAAVAYDGPPPRRW